MLASGMPHSIVKRFELQHQQVVHLHSETTAATHYFGTDRPNADAARQKRPLWSLVLGICVSGMAESQIIVLRILFKLQIRNKVRRRILLKASGEATR